MSEPFGPGIPVPIRKDEEGNLLHPFTGAKMEEVKPGVWQDPVGALLDRMMDRALTRMVEDTRYRFSTLGRYDLANNPWPKRGHDFRLNPDRNRFPYEPEYCETCGHRLDDEDDY